MIPYGSTSSERALMARALALLFVAGGALVLLTLLLPRGAGSSTTGLLAAPLVAFVVAAGLRAGGDRLGVGALQVLLALGSVLITVCVLAGGTGASAYPALYVLVSTFAFFFFGRRAALAQVGVAAALYAGALLGTEDTPVEAAHWLMVLGTITVGGLLIGRLSTAVREQAADVAEVSRLAGGSDVVAALRATCEGLVASLGADVAITLEIAPDGDGLTVTAMTGSAEAGMAFAGDRARLALEQSFRTAEPVEIFAERPARGVAGLGGAVLGVAQPVIRDGIAVAVLAVAWTRPRRSLPERTRNVALLYAAQASMTLARAELVAQDRERQALEINDNIVQGLVVAKYTVQRGDVDGAVAALDDTLMRARKLISDQLSDVVTGRGIQPGDLARAEAAGVKQPGSLRVPTPPPASPR